MGLFDRVLSGLEPCPSCGAKSRRWVQFDCGQPDLTDYALGDEVPTCPDNESPVLIEAWPDECPHCGSPKTTGREPAVKEMVGGLEIEGRRLRAVHPVDEETAILLRAGQVIDIL